MKTRKLVVLLISALFILSIFAGCSSTKNEPETTETNTAVAEVETTVETTTEEPVPEEIVDIEVWGTNNGFLPIEKDSPIYNFYKEVLGVGVIQPYVEWDGGSGYLQALNLIIAAGEMPDMFSPHNGIEKDLAKSGAILDLTDLLPEKAPDFWNLVSPTAWEVMKTMDPNGQGRIYATPSTVDYGWSGGLIRQDWLDTLELPMPTTLDEFTDVLRAFRDNDPNGNGQKDEFATGGRAEARWMDHLFAMYGIAIWEGYPQWDIYDGELTYSAITQNMRDCLEYLSMLYAEGLMDPETLLNDKPAWDAKVGADRVGVFFRILQEMNLYSEDIYRNTGVKAVYSALPIIDAPGYEGFYTKLGVKNPQWVIKNQDNQDKVDACFTLLNNFADKSIWYDLYMGVEGMHHEVINGVKSKLPDDKTTQQNLFFTPFNEILSLDFQIQLLNDTIASAPDRTWALQQSLDSMTEVQQYTKFIAGDGIPAFIYDGYPDIQNRTLYKEYVSMIIAGEYPISKFDEFVEKWYQTGGEQVTEAARAWYAQMGGN